MKKCKYKIVHGACLLLLGLLALIGCSRKNPLSKQDTKHSETTNSQEAEKMSTEKILERIKQKDRAVIAQEPKITTEVAQSVAQLIHDEDPEVRKMALEVLNNNPGKPTRQAMITGLRDKNINVRSLACRMLLTHYDKSDLQILSNELATNEDEFVREHIALALGKIADPAAITPLQTQLTKEVDTNARHAMHLALTRLKEPENQKQYVHRLKQIDPKEKAQAILDFQYIKDKLFLPEMITLLDDKRPALNVGKSNKKIYIRVCDVVINTLDIVLEHPFAFDIFPRKEYTAEEIRQAKEILRGIIKNG